MNFKIKPFIQTILVATASMITSPLSAQKIPVMICDGINVSQEIFFDENMNSDTTISEIKKKIEQEKNIPLHKQRITKPNDSIEIAGHTRIWELIEETKPLVILYFYTKKSTIKTPLKKLLGQYCSNSDATLIAYGSASENPKNAQFQQFPNFFSQAAEKNNDKKFTIILIDGLFKNNECGLPSGLSKIGWTDWTEIKSEPLSNFFRIYQQKNVTVLVFPYSLERTEETRNEFKLPYAINRSKENPIYTCCEQNIKPQEDPLVRVFSKHFTRIIKDTHKKVFFSHCDSPKTFAISKPLNYFYFIQDVNLLQNKNIYAYSPWTDHLTKGKETTPTDIIWDTNNTLIEPKTNSNESKKTLSVAIKYVSNTLETYELEQGTLATVKDLKDAIEKKSGKSVHVLIFSGEKLCNEDTLLTITKTPQDLNDPICCVLKK